VAYASIQQYTNITRENTMRKNNFLIIAILLVASLVLSGCRKSATNTPADVPTAEEQDLMSTVLTAQANSTEETDGNKSIKSTEESSDADNNAPIFFPSITPDVAPVPTNTPAPTVPPTAEPVVAPTTYTLHEGEYPFCLARRFDIEWTSFVASNPNVNFTDSGAFYAGLKFSIPQGGAGFGAERVLIAHPGTYTVGVGESIYSVACSFGDVYPESIAQVNGLPNDDTAIPSGTLLQIP
jgi:hypothetical protein